MKKRIFTLYLFLAIAFSHTAQDLKNGLVYMYKFDGDVSDASGNNLHATNNGATYATNRLGTPNSCLALSGYPNYVALPNDPALKPSFPFSVSVWVYFDNLNMDYSIFTNDYKEDVYTGAWVTIKPNAGGLVFWAGYGNGGDSGGNGIASTFRRSKYGTTKVVKEQWYHVTAVFESENDIQLYVGCENDGGSLSGSATEIVYSNNNGSIGRKDCSYNVVDASEYYLEGKVDNLLFYNRALTAEEVGYLCTDVIENNQLSVADNQLARLEVYPNPAVEKLTINTKVEGEIGYKIVSNAGAIVTESSTFDKSIKLDAIESGLYWLIVLDAFGTEIGREKFVKL